MGADPCLILQEYTKAAYYTDAVGSGACSADALSSKAASGRSVFYPRLYLYARAVSGTLGMAEIAGKAV